MRAYRVEVGGRFRFAGTQAESREFRDSLGGKRGSGKIEEVEIPLAKPELLKFINGLISDLEPAE